MSVHLFNCLQRALTTVGRRAIATRSHLLMRRCPSAKVNQRLLSYDGDGKTTVTLINQEEADLLILDTYSNTGFRLNNGIFLVGPVAIFPRSVFQWDVNSVADVNEESLSLFWLLEPKIDILIVGTGNKGLHVDPKVRLFMARKGINMECLPTAQAIPLFNFMNIDRRNVAAALIPPVNVDFNDRAEDYVDLHVTRKTIHEDLRLMDRNLYKHLDENRMYTELVAEREKEQELMEKNKSSNDESKPKKW